MGLEWIYENIESFGGSTDRIVFVGQGMGAISALLHGKDFQPKRIISSSGSLNMKFPFSPNPIEISNQIAKKLKCESSLLNCLQDKSTEQIISISMNNGLWPFGFVLDEENLTFDNLENVDILFGFNTGDGYQWTADQYPRLNQHPVLAWVFC